MKTEIYAIPQSKEYFARVLESNQWFEWHNLIRTWIRIPFVEARNIEFAERTSKALICGYKLTVNNFKPKNFMDDIDTNEDLYSQFINKIAGQLDQQKLVLNQNICTLIKSILPNCEILLDKDTYHINIVPSNLVLPLIGQPAQFSFKFVSMWELIVLKDEVAYIRNGKNCYHKGSEYKVTYPVLSLESLIGVLRNKLTMLKATMQHRAIRGELLGLDVYSDEYLYI